MTIPFNHKLTTFKGRSRIDALPLKDDNKEWLVWWYAGMAKNKKAEYQPHVVVGLREVVGGEVSDTFSRAWIPVTMLGQVRIGSVWKNRVCIKQFEFETRTFDVDFTKNAWCFNNFKSANSKNADLPFNQKIYPLEYQNSDKTPLLEFPISTGGKLVIPCIEYFTRSYGCSGELKRILATYPWQGQDAPESKLYAPLAEGEIDDGSVWKVNLRRQLYNGDIVLLAHAKYDPYTENVVKAIYSQIETMYDPSRPSVPIPIEVAPWFQGAAQLMVKGIWFNNKSFLALNVVGSSEPGGTLIERDRANTNKVKAPADAKDAGKAWNGAPERVSELPEIVDLTVHAEPDQGAERIEVQDEDFVILGKPREIKDKVRDKAKNSKGFITNGSEATCFSTGEAHGTGKGVGQASINAKAVIESEGMLLDMWNALLYFKDKYPQQIKRVEWFTFERGYNSDEKPRLIEVPSFEGNIQGLSKQIIRWPYVNPDLRIPRGILVMRVSIGGRFVHFVELQRRRKVDDETGELTDKENFMGVVFIAHSQSDVESNIKYLMSSVSLEKGIVKNIIGGMLGQKDVFQHSPSNDQEVACGAAVENALGKLGITLELR